MSSLRQKYAIDGEVPALVDTTGDDIFLGYAVDSGSATSAPEWAIEKISNSGGLYGLRLWAGSSKKKNKVWDNRSDGTYTYGRVI